MTEVERAEAQRIVAEYRAHKGRAPGRQYLAYMRARKALGEALTAGQRGFLEAARGGSVVDAPADSALVARPAPPPLPVAQPVAVDDAPAWTFEPAGVDA